MNVCDYYVEEVLGQPIFETVTTPEGVRYSWWKVKVSYFYETGELKIKDLLFDTELEACEVKKGYHFVAQLDKGCKQMVTRSSDGTICDYCGNLVLTKIELEYVEDGHIFCCKECADDFKKT